MNNESQKKETHKLNKTAVDIAATALNFSLCKQSYAMI